MLRSGALPLAASLVRDALSEPSSHTTMNGGGRGGGGDSMLCLRSEARCQGAMNGDRGLLGLGGPTWGWAYQRPTYPVYPPTPHPTPCRPPFAPAPPHSLEVALPPRPPSLPAGVPPPSLPAGDGPSPGQLGQPLLLAIKAALSPLGDDPPEVCRGGDDLPEVCVGVGDDPPEVCVGGG